MKSPPFDIGMATNSALYPLEQNPKPSVAKGSA